MSPPLVSIIIPCYNAGRWLAATLESALAQSHPHCEIIVVDDGSTDDSLTVARSFSDRGVRVFSQANAGQCAACNLAFRQAKGAFIKFFDADDLLSADAVAIQVAALHNRPDGCLAYGEWARFQTDPAEAVFIPRPGWHDSDSPVDWICETWRDTEPMYQCALWLIPRDLITRIGGWDERLSLINDFEFFTRLVLVSTGIVHTPGARLYYRSGLPGSLSGRKSRRAWESAARSTRLAIDHLLAREDSAITRGLGANMLQKLVFAFYPEHADLRNELLVHIRRLGGSALRPDGGRAFQLLARYAGWRFACRLRYRLGRRPA